MISNSAGALPNGIPAGGFAPWPSHPPGESRATAREVYALVACALAAAVFAAALVEFDSLAFSPAASARVVYQCSVQSEGVVCGLGVRP